MVYYVKVAKEDIEAGLGMANGSGRKALSFPRFPSGLNKASEEGLFFGNCFVEKNGLYRLIGEPKGILEYGTIGKQKLQNQTFWLGRGFHPIRIKLNEKYIPSNLYLALVEEEGDAIIPLDSGHLTTLPLGGLNGEYRRAEKDKALMEGLDPLVNFSYRRDFLIPDAPLWIDWTGSLWAPETGLYQIIVLTEPQDHFSLWMDGKTMGKSTGSAPVAGTLALRK